MHKLLAHYPNKFVENFFFVRYIILRRTHIDYITICPGTIAITFTAAELHFPAINYEFEK